MKTWKWLALSASFLMLFFGLSGCGVLFYPGQSGMQTNQYSKIDLEDLQPEGLYVYESVYDNSSRGQGVGAIITKLYPGAKTYTSNARSNEDGTFYRHKAQYAGAVLQMISIPATGQVYLPPNSQIQLFLEYDASLSEHDDKNLSEEFLFHPKGTSTGRAPGKASTAFVLWNTLRAGTWERGGLSYSIEAVDLGGIKFVPEGTVKVQTNLFMNSLNMNLSSGVKASALQFLETNYPKGYKGDVLFYVKGKSEPIVWHLGLHSLKTAAAKGIQIIHTTQDRVQSLYDSFLQSRKERS